MHKFQPEICYNDKHLGRCVAPEIVMQLLLINNSCGLHCTQRRGKLGSFNPSFQLKIYLIFGTESLSKYYILRIIIIKLYCRMWHGCRFVNVHAYFGLFCFTFIFHEMKI